MMKAGKDSDDFKEMLLDLISSVWRERTVPQEWVNAISSQYPRRVTLPDVTVGEGYHYLKLLGKLWPG